MNKNTVRIYGGPGCGKTSHLLRILDELLEETIPSKIGFVSFTNKGVNAGIDRARLKYGIHSKKDVPYWGTIHAMANRVATRDKGKVINADNYKLFSIATNMRFLGFFTEELSHGDDIYLFMEQLYRINRQKYERMFDLIPDMARYEWVVKQYNQFKSVYSLFDFTDMLEYYIEYNQPLPIDYMIIDEAQDLSPLQWRCIELMSRNCKKVYIAGDDDQAIYEWCGGDVGFFNSIDTVDEVILDQSYRVCGSVLNAADKVIRGVAGRKGKQIHAIRKEQGKIVTCRQFENIKLDCNKSYYILARNRCYLSAIKRTLMLLNVPFTYCGEVYPRKISGKFKTRISQEEYNYSKHMRDSGYTRSPRDKLITVDTIHRVKGGEADEVILLLDCTTAVQNNLLENLDEELRVLYVAITRCRFGVNLVYGSSVNSYDTIMAKSLAGA